MSANLREIDCAIGIERAVAKALQRLRQADLVLCGPVVAVSRGLMRRGFPGARRWLRVIVPARTTSCTSPSRAIPSTWKPLKLKPFASRIVQPPWPPNARVQ